MTQKGGLAKQMPGIKVRFFGFNRKGSGLETETRHVADGTTVGDVWESLRASAHPDEILARVDKRTVAVLVNRRVIDREEIRQSVLTEGDTVTFMVFVMGG